MLTEKTLKLFVKAKIPTKFIRNHLNRGFSQNMRNFKASKVGKAWKKACRVKLKGDKYPIVPNKTLSGEERGLRI